MPPPPPQQGKTEVFPFGTSSCATGPSGELKCWGSNVLGQLGYGDTSSRGGNSNSMETLSLVALPGGERARQISGSTTFSCVLTESGRVYCNGLNNLGQLGIDGTNQVGNTPASIATRIAVNFGAGLTAKFIASTADSTCAILSNDTVKCWGRGTGGVLGNDATTNIGHNSTTTVALSNSVYLGASARKPVLLAAASSSFCALFDDGKIRCWGSNSLGQLGINSSDSNKGSNPTTASMTTAADIAFATTERVTKVAGGKDHYCALFADNSVRCWGSNNGGQLGYNDAINRGTVTSPTTALNALDFGTGFIPIDIAAAYNSTCAVSQTGRVKCWGEGSHGKTLADTHSNIGSGEVSIASRSAFSFPNGARAITIRGASGSFNSTGNFGHFCAQLDDDNNFCWGSNDSGQLGVNDSLHRGSGGPATIPPIDFGSSRTAIKIGSGKGFTCALLSDGNVKCWGDNSQGYLGIDSTTTVGRSTSSPLSSSPNVILPTTANNLSVGHYGVCVLLTNGAARCWGKNSYGENGSEQNAFSIGSSSSGLASMLNLGNVIVSGTFLQISRSLGDGHACSLMAGGNAKCWGRGSYGILGQNSATDTGTNAGAMSATGFINLGLPATMISAGYDHTCALLNNGSVKCWGKNTSGQLGYDDTTMRGYTSGHMASLTTVNLGRPAISIHAGFDMTCAVLDNNQVKCWGDNQYGQLGYGHTSTLGNKPGDMATLGTINFGDGRTVSKLSLGMYHACALMDNAQAKCWGRNSSHQLGLIHSSDVWTPEFTAAIEFGSGQSVLDIAAGATHTCVILTGGIAKCFGSNNSGEAGQNSTAPSFGMSLNSSALAPVKVTF